MTEDCPFCRVVRGDETAYVLYEDDRTVAFLDRNPAVEGHTLVVPKRHRRELLSGDGSTGVWETVQRVSAALDGALDPAGFSTVHTSGRLVGNVDHAHVHVLPRYEGDPVHIALERRTLREHAAERIASAVRAEL